MDEMKMAVSHGQSNQADQPMTPEEAKAIVAHYKDDVPGIMALMPKLSGPEKETLMSQMSVSHGEPGIAPGLVGGAVGLASKALKYAPTLGKVGNAVKGTVGGVVGYEGTKAVTDAIGLPPGIANIINMIGGGLGHHATGGFGSTPAGGGAALSAEEEALAALKARGAKISSYTPPDPPQTTPGKYPVPNSSKMGVEIPPLTRADMPSNVSFKRTNADLAEQTSRGLQVPKMEIPTRANMPSNVTFDRSPAELTEQTSRGFDAKQVTPKASSMNPDIRVRHLSAGEEDGIQRLGYHMDATGTGTKGNGLYKEPGKSSFDKTEFPPGTDKSTKPSIFDKASRNHADAQTDPEELDRTRAMIEKAFDNYNKKTGKKK